MALSMRASQQSFAAALSARNPAATAATRRAAAAAAAATPNSATAAAGVAATTPRATAAAAGAAKAVVRQNHRLQFAAKSSVHSSFAAKFRPTGSGSGTGARAQPPTSSSFLAPSSFQRSSTFPGRRLLPGSLLLSPCQGFSSTIQKNLAGPILPSLCSAREKVLNKPKKSGLEVRVGAPADSAGEGRGEEDDKVARPRKDARPGGAPGSGSSARKSRRVEGLGVIGDQSAAQHHARQQKSPPPPLPPPLGERPASGQKSKNSKSRKTKRDGAAAAGNGSMRGAVDESMYEEADALLGLEDRQLTGGEEDLPGSQFMDAVVKVYCTHTEPNFSLPWQKRRQFQSTGSGFMVSGRRLLTNAHCVDHHTQVKVKRRGDDTKFVARVLAIGVECDIALLAVDDDAFWEGPVPLRFGSLPHLQDAVTVVGYPVGGDSISVTSGVVSRIEVTPYSHGSTELLGVQIDAAINAGNSGGPAFNESGECVGIAFQSLKTADTENIGYIIPTPVIFHFLGDYSRNGAYTGFPSIGISWQRMESPALRAALGMAAAQKGVFIRRVEPTSPAHSVLRPGDILLSFDGVPIANDGTVSFRTGERISFGFLVSQKFSGQDGQLEVLRDGQVMSVSVTLRPQKRLIPVHIEGKPPSYFIAAGLVFTPVCEPFLLSEYGQDYEYDTPVSILQKLLHGQAQFEDEEVVVLSQVLANDCNIGYEDITNAIVKTVNGMPVRNLRQLASLVDSCCEQFLKIELEHAQLVVLEAAQVKAATSQVLLDHSIPQDRSDNLSKAEGANTLNGQGAAAAAAPDAAGASAGGSKGVAAEAAGKEVVQEDEDEVEDMMEEEEVTVLEVVGRAPEQGGKRGKGGRKGREELPKKAEKRKVKGRR